VVSADKLMLLFTPAVMKPPSERTGPENVVCDISNTSLRKDSPQSLRKRLLSQSLGLGFISDLQCMPTSQ